MHVILRLHSASLSTDARGSRSLTYHHRRPTTLPLSFEHAMHIELCTLGHQFVQSCHNDDVRYALYSIQRQEALH